MNEYQLRPANENDIEFITEVIIAAEKGNTNLLGFSTLFNLSETEVRKAIESMLGEEIDFCEFSISSFYIVTYNNIPVAAFGGWIEAMPGEMPSKILKSNLLGYTLSKESIAFLKTKSDIIKDTLIEREEGCLQLEYLYVNYNHRGKGLPTLLINALIERAKTTNPLLKKVQVQTFRNNENAIKVYLKNGFKITQTALSHHPEIFNYLPHNEKILLEKNLIN
ncbi:MAG TPA: GNAT family N-acetyltransferase [Bacteroidia bacterium]|nr:GNAT family N-acetyltransferase [Bacteroidia bacterium]